MGGLDGNARVRMTPQMASERASSMGLSKAEMTENIEHVKVGA